MLDTRGGGESPGARATVRNAASAASLCLSPPSALVTRGNTDPHRATARLPHGPDDAIVASVSLASRCTTVISDVNNSTTERTVDSAIKSACDGSLEIGNNARESYTDARPLILVNASAA
tara:strand:+ start:687 stop:1046 length:360 start_codon:yes stop_codon:yes gene_type:complete